MYKGTRKQYQLRKDQVLELKSYVNIFLHNMGSSTVNFGGYKILPSEKHTVETGGVFINEDINVSFDGNDNLLYASVVSVKECN